MKILIWILYSYIFSAKHFRWTYTFSSALIIQWTLWLLCSAHMLFIEYHSVNAMAFMFRPHAVCWTSFSECNGLILCSDHMLLAEHHSVNIVAVMFRPHAIGWTSFSEYNGFYIQTTCYLLGRSCGAKVMCILRHWGVQLILAYSWARPAVLVAGKGRGGIFFISFVSSLSFLFLFLPCSSFSSLLLSLLSLFSLSLGDDTKWPTRVDMSLSPNTKKTPKNMLFAEHHSVNAMA